jgi:hypothetical protein
MEISFSLPHVFNPLSSSVEDTEALKVLLDTLIKLNVSYDRRYHPLPLYKAGVIYGRTTVWDTVPALYARKYGDCKSLSAALIAEYLVKGIPALPMFRFKKRKDGGSDWHILVLVDGTRFEDPSSILGMNKDELKHFR